MKKLTLLFAIVVASHFGFGQPKGIKAKESYKSVDDAVKFLNKTFAKNQGIREIEASVGSEAPTYLTSTFKIDNIDITPDSVLIIKYTVAHGESNEEGVISTTDRYAFENPSTVSMELRRTSLIHHYHIYPPQDKSGYPDGTRSTLINIAFNTNKYEISCQHAMGTISNLTFSDYLSNKNIDEKKFDASAKMVADAFNFIIKHSGGGRD